MRYHHRYLFTLSLLLCSSLYRAFSTKPSSTSASTRNSKLPNGMKAVQTYLVEECQDATAAEIARFTAAYGKPKGPAERAKEAVETRLKTYLDWRKQLGLDSRPPQGYHSDEAAWEDAVNRAFNIEASQGLGGAFQSASCFGAGGEALENACETEDVKTAKEGRPGIDQVIFFHKNEKGEAIRDKNGKRIMHLLPARINPELATPETYANVFAFYLDYNFGRTNTDKVTILVDIRAGEGWANTPVLAMRKVLKRIISVFEYNFPERVEKFVVFPVPRIARGLFNAIKVLFDSNTAKKICLVTGPDGVDAAVPKLDIEEYIDGAVIDQTEEARLSYFSSFHLVRTSPGCDSNETTKSPKRHVRVFVRLFVPDAKSQTRLGRRKDALGHFSILLPQKAIQHHLNDSSGVSMRSHLQQKKH
eukprot:scaffold8136_cov127-Cylindrotheca_fusiformis.AAC.21